MAPPAISTRNRWTMTRAQCHEGIGKSVPDLVGPGLRVLFVGINPSNCSGAAGLHFASPGNRFWPAIHQAGFTDRQLRPDERGDLLESGIGITNLSNRATAKASEVDNEELLAGGLRLQGTIREYRPRFVAVLGKRAYAIAFGQPKPEFGRQPRDLEGAALWLLPNPSGLNAHYQVPELAAQFAELRIRAFE